METQIATTVSSWNPLFKPIHRRSRKNKLITTKIFDSFPSLSPSLPEESAQKGWLEGINTGVDEAGR